jgi:hypothetical protein
MRKEKEIAKLEQLYEEKRQRMEDKARLERESQMTLERYTEERRRVERVRDERMERDSMSKTQVKRGIPVLMPTLKKSMPLLIGSTMTLRLEDMTRYQIQSLEVAKSLHQEHCRKIDEEEGVAGEEGGIEAAPIVAVIDHYTGVGSDAVDKSRRFATLAAVEVVKGENGEPELVNLMGVGRVFLRDYFSSKDAGLTKEEVELSKLLQTIRDLGDSEEIDSIEDDDDDDEDLSIVMAEFDLFLDNSSILSRSSEHQDVSKQRASSIHAVTELYQTANKVYRLHEERKRLLSGLRAGQARLHETDNGVIEYDDWSDTVDSIEHDMIQDYGFGTYGIFSTIPDLTKEVMSCLEPYYSSSHRQREEYEAEVASFVALRALEKCADPSELAAAMMTPSATERLYMAYGLMSRHRDELLVMIKKMTDDLTECGEE